MHHIICTACQTHLRPYKTGAYVLEMMNERDPYRLWAVDIKKCPGCEVEIVEGFGQNPIAQHFEEDLLEREQKMLDQGQQVVRWYPKPTVETEEQTEVR